MGGFFSPAVSRKRKWNNGNMHRAIKYDNLTEREISAYVKTKIIRVSWTLTKLLENVMYSDTEEAVEIPSFLYHKRFQNDTSI